MHLGLNSQLNSARMAPMKETQNGDHCPPLPQRQFGDFEAPEVATGANDDFLDQMLSSLPAWNEFAAPNEHGKTDRDLKQDDESDGVSLFHFDDSEILFSTQRQHHMNGRLSAERMMVMPPSEVGQIHVGNGSLFNSLNSGLEGSIQGLYSGFAESLQSSQPHRLLQSQVGNFGAPAQAQGINSTGEAPAQPRQRVRARRGQATDPHSIAERLRRERIAERMKGLQELVPNANKTDKASMLDEIIDYVKFLQLQVKVLSMSRLGGAAAVAPLVADISSETRNAIANGRGVGGNGAQTADQSAMTMTEQQVAKLMEEDMGSAMQYLQGKGLCLMPISLANAIPTATCHSRGLLQQPDDMFLANGGGPTSPNSSVLTVQPSALGKAVNDSFP